MSWALTEKWVVRIIWSIVIGAGVVIWSTVLFIGFTAWLELLA